MLLLKKIITRIKKEKFSLFMKYCFHILCPNKVSFSWQCRRLKINLIDYHYLKKKFCNVTNKIDWEHKEDFFPEKIVWTCWLQGEKNAPEIVRICIESMRKNLTDYKIIIITNNNLANYITMPDYILEKYEKGQICAAHFTDLIRLELLENYGGFWMDSTLLCTSKKMMDEILSYKPDLFVFKNYFSLDVTTCMSNWFIFSKKNNPYLHTVKEMMYEYWKKNNYARNYYIFHMFFLITAELRKKEWDDIPVFLNEPPHLLQEELFNQFNENRYHQLMKMTDLHKLSYKFEESKFKKRDTMYFHIKEQYGKSSSTLEI